MRLLATVSVLVLGVSAPALAADDFGPRFTEDAPSAFSDPAEDSPLSELSMEGAAELMQEIMPAAGDMEEDVPMDDEPQAEEAPVLNEIGEEIAQ